MQRLKTVLAELFGLFVDDGSFAVAIIAWLVIAYLVLPRVDMPPSLKGPILFAGLAAILVESAARRARRQPALPESPGVEARF